MDPRKLLKEIKFEWHENCRRIRVHTWLNPKLISLSLSLSLSYLSPVHSEVNYLNIKNNCETKNLKIIQKKLDSILYYIVRCRINYFLSSKLFIFHVWQYLEMTWMIHFCLLHLCILLGFAPALAPKLWPYIITLVFSYDLNN